MGLFFSDVVTGLFFVVFCGLLFIVSVALDMFELPPPLLIAEA